MNNDQMTTQDILNSMKDDQRTYFMCFSGMNEEFVAQMWKDQQVENQRIRDTKMSIARLGLVGGLIGAAATIGAAVIGHKDSKALTSSINALNDTVSSIGGVVQVNN